MLVSVAEDSRLISNHFNCWIRGRSVLGDGESIKIRNPANEDDLIAEVRYASNEQVDSACEAAADSFSTWRAIPAMERVRVLFRYRELLEKNFESISKLIVRENGKLLSEARGSLRRGIDVVEFACGLPAMLTGTSVTDVSKHVDSHTEIEPLGVVVGIPPYNFPAMIPLWMMPIAIGCGNTFVLKPAEKAPLTGALLASLFEEAGLPAGVVNIVHGGRQVSERLISNPEVAAISFVGSSPVAEAVYKAGTAAGKRVQALGGAKNYLVVVQDADLPRSVPAIINSCFGSAGQRCLAGSVLIAVGSLSQQNAVVDAIVHAASELVLGSGCQSDATLGPLISSDHRRRVINAIDQAASEGAKVILDGRNALGSSIKGGHFVGPTVLDRVAPNARIVTEEVFGPVLTILRASTLGEAVGLANNSRYGNSASIFTSSGAAAREFRSSIQVGMIGVNLGVPAPMAMFSFGGWKKSFFGDLNAYGSDAVRFYTRKKVVTERWFGAEAPKQGWA